MEEWIEVHVLLR